MELVLPLSGNKQMAFPDSLIKTYYKTYSEHLSVMYWRSQSPMFHTLEIIIDIKMEKKQKCKNNPKIQIFKLTKASY